MTEAISLGLRLLATKAQKPYSNSLEASLMARFGKSDPVHTAKSDRNAARVRANSARGCAATSGCYQQQQASNSHRRRQNHSAPWRPLRGDRGRLTRRVSPHLSPLWGHLVPSKYPCRDWLGTRSGVLSTPPMSAGFRSALLTPSSRWDSLSPASLPALTRRGFTLRRVGGIKDIHHVLYAHAASTTGCLECLLRTIDLEHGVIDR